MTPGHTLRGGIKGDMKHPHGLNSGLFAPYLYNYMFRRFYDRELIFQLELIILFSQNLLILFTFLIGPLKV